MESSTQTENQTEEVLQTEIPSQRDDSIQSDNTKDSAKAPRSRGLTKVIILQTVIIALLLVIGVIVTVQLTKKDEEVTVSGPKMAYESGVITDEESAKRAAEEMEKAAEGMMTMQMKLTASSEDGEHFKCEIWNATQNSYDMYLQIMDDEDGSLIYQSGLIPIGAKIESFTSEKKLSVGTHSVTLIFHQMEDDQATEHAVVSSGYTLQVY